MSPPLKKSSCCLQHITEPKVSCVDCHQLTYSGASHVAAKRGHVWYARRSRALNASEIISMRTLAAYKKDCHLITRINPSLPEKVLP